LKPARDVAGGGVMLRPLQASDLDAVLEIQRAAYGDAYQESAAVLGRKLALAPQACWLAGRAGEALGYVFAHPWRHGVPPRLHAPIAALPAAPDCGFVHDLAVSPRARGAGVAAALLARVAAWSAAAGLDGLSLVALADAVGFWRRHGFVAGALELPPAYGAGAVLMRRVPA
jgi:GNAT superfamily N-acetyltransferase